MTLTRDCICPIVLTRGSDQLPVSTKFDMRNDPGVVRNYGKLITELAAVVPDGMVCFFVSYSVRLFNEVWCELCEQAVSSPCTLTR
jgi:DNA excision repair protein ERCC-2